MALKSIIKAVKWMTAVGSIICLGCSPHQDPKYNKILRIFFDGVPLIEQRSDDREQEQQKTPVRSEAGKKQQEYIHPPYENGSCIQCHGTSSGSSSGSALPNIYSMGELSEKIGDKCFQCHEDNKTDKKYVHWPVESKQCTSCHNPHKEKRKYFLKKPGKELCYGCHAPDDEKSHISKKESCVTSSCHDPHSSDEQFQLRGSLEDCVKCHSFNPKYTHNPVEQGYCTSCHEGHGSKNKEIVIQQPPGLCLMCHDGGDVKKVEYHSRNLQNILEADCTGCHDQHGSDNKHILRWDPGE